MGIPIPTDVVAGTLPMLGLLGNPNGHLRPLAIYATPDGFRLGLWLSALRHKRRLGELSSGQIAELDAIGMTWDPLNDDWERAVGAAGAYWRDQGHLRVSQAHVDRSGFKLGTWISSKRQACRKGVLSAARIAELDALGMVWSPREKADTTVSPDRRLLGPSLRRANDLYHDLVSHTRRGRDLVDAVASGEESADLVLPFALGPFYVVG